MLRVSLTVTLLMGLTARLSAQEQPKGPPPKFMTAQVDDAGRPYLTTQVVRYKKATRTETVVVNGQQVNREVEFVVAHKVYGRVAFDRPGVDVYDNEGKRLDPKEVKLQGPTALLVSADGRAVDPFYLRLARPGTLVVVSRDLADAVHPSAPPAPRDRN